MPTLRLKVFVSSVQKEFAAERRQLKAFLLGDPVLRRFISEVFLFEELPASDRKADEVYLAEVGNCDIYVAILGNEYGSADASGMSPSELEFSHASELGKTRLIYVWGADDKRRHPRMSALIRRASAELVRRRVSDISALNAEVYSSLVDYLDKKNALRVPPFDTSTVKGAALKHLSLKRIKWFIETARRERRFPLKSGSSPHELLSHLNLMDDSRPTNAAVLLFASHPQKFHRSAEIKCISCHGTEYQRPFASQQIYAGDLFEQADLAREFVLSRIDREVGTRARTNAAAATYELPPDAVAEAIINALAHRDYNSNGSVEVRLFSDRLEVWNPGTLPGNLTLDDLARPHPSIPFNPLLAESLYLARYIEKAGSGTERIIDLCRQSGLPDPTFEIRAGSFVVTIWRDWISDDIIMQLGLSKRQERAIRILKRRQTMTNAVYQERLNVSKPTATRDLEALVRKGVLEKVGKTGKGTYYILSRKRLTKGSKGSHR